jgi:hypothetical protein
MPDSRAGTGRREEGRMSLLEWEYRSAMDRARKAEAEAERLREALQRIDIGLTDFVENGAECTMDPQDVLEIVRHALVTPGGNHGGTDA